MDDSFEFDYCGTYGSWDRFVSVSLANSSSVLLPC